MRQEVGTSIEVNDRHLVGAEKLVESAGEQGFHVLAGLSAHKHKAALEVGREIRADMHVGRGFRRLGCRAASWGLVGSIGGDRREGGLAACSSCS